MPIPIERFRQEKREEEVTAELEEFFRIHQKEAFYDKELLQSRFLYVSLGRLCARGSLKKGLLVGLITLGGREYRSNA